MAVNRRKRILLVTRNFPPLTGGMERLNFHIYLELQKEFEIFIAGPDGCQNFLSLNTGFSVFPPKPVGLFLIRSFIATYRLAAKEKPDLIIAGSGVTSLAALWAARMTGAKLINYLHGLDIIYPSPIYQALFIPAIRASDRVFVNSSHTAELALQKKIDANKIEILNPGVSIPNNMDDLKANNLFRKSFSIPEDNIILLSVGRLTERKGLAEFIGNCLPDLARQFPKILLVIIGNEATDALNQKESTTTRIKNAAINANVVNHVLFLGQVSDNNLAQAYLSSDILIFPVLDLPGDVEGFGMVAVEAAAHGLPTMAFAVGGVVDAVDQGKSGWLINSGDYKSLTQTISNFLKKTMPEKAPTRSSCQNFAMNFTWDKFGEKLTNIIQNI